MTELYKNSPIDARVTTLESFRRDAKSKLLFFTDLDGRERLCIPRKSIDEVLQIAHDDRAYVGGERTYDFLRQHVFFLRMSRVVRQYVKSCPICNPAQPDNQKPKGLLIPSIATR